MVRVTVTAFVAALLASASATTPPADRTSPQPGIQIDADDPAQLKMARWAVGRFEEAGLALPDLRIVFPGRDLSLCDGAPATALTSQRPIEIRMCWNDKFMLLHELAHAWDAHNLTKNCRKRFMALRTDVDGWTGAAIPWDRRGIEHAANVIAWGLLEDPHPVSRTHPNDPDSMIEAFMLLTEVGPLHDGGFPIAEPDRGLYEGRSNPRPESGQ